MEPHDPRKFDWPLPEPGSEAEQAFAEESALKAAEGLREDLARLPSMLSEGFADLLAECFDDSPAPSESVYALERMFATHPAHVQDFVAASLLSPRAFRRMFTLLGHSRVLGRFLLQHGWREFLQLGDEQLGQPVTTGDVAADTRARIAAGVDVKTALRHAHYLWAARVLYREVQLLRPLEEIGAEISALADAALEVALEHARRELLQSRGLQAGADFRFCVIAMGKLGANELNYASDIDLIFIYDGEGPERTGAQGYAVKLAEALIPLLDDVTEHGRVFRVDTRLRPEGKRGRLARSLKGTLDYYYSFGTTLERQALIKARPAAGDLALGHELVRGVQGWVYRKYLTVEEINQIQSLKRGIEQQSADQLADLKTGFGGIRDIEFITQFLQLLNGGRIDAVRTPATLHALDALARNGVLNPHEALELADAYRFLRAVEHRLQLWEGAQTHTLPSHPGALARIGRALGLRGSGPIDAARRLLHTLGKHTLRSRGLMVRLFAGLFDAHRSPAESELVLDPEMTGQQARPIFTRYGFSDPDAAFRAVRELSEESPENRLYAPRARKYLASMMPALLQFCADSPQPDFTLLNFERICANLGAKTMLFELVAEDPRALSIFGSIAAHSAWLTDILARRPGLVDEFIDRLQTFTALDRQVIRDDLHARLAFAADATDALFWQRDVELLRIGLFDITGRTPLPETLRELCALAEVLLEFALARTLDDECRRDGALNPAALREGFAVIAMGKLGSGSMNYASDLDLVFAYDAAHFSDPAHAQQASVRVARATRDMLSQSGERGRLYEVDLRLRPRGSASPLANSLDELARYLSAEASYWERIAATRARVLDASTPAGGRAHEVLQGFVYGAKADAVATREMRARLEAEPGNRLKRGPGGTLDIEFLLAHLQIKHRVPEPGLWEAIDSLAERGVLSAADADAIGGAYAFLRGVVNRLQLLDGTSRHELPPGPELEVFARRMGYTGNALQQLTEELQWHTAAARRLYDKYVQ
ncbi:MAG: hypothetical protein KF696_12025 [Planctomycetes bacterium]|nr:hypothetical protein [Planctomycetota bacterium]MCW8137015.1 hypothetical protein [Planctomycetota bacterium]